MRRCQGRDDADRCLPVFLRMYWLRRAAEAEGGRLLRVLLLRRRAVSSGSGGAGKGRIELLSGRLTHVERQTTFGRLGRQPSHQHLGLVASSPRDYCRPHGSNSCADRDLDHRPRLDGGGMHPQRPSLWTNPLPVHRAVLLCNDTSCRRTRIWHQRQFLRMDRRRRTHLLWWRDYLDGNRASVGEVLAKWASRASRRPQRLQQGRLISNQEATAASDL